MRTIKKLKISFVIGIAAIGSVFVPGRSQAASQEAASAQCESIKKLELSRLLDAPTQINDSQWVRANEDRPDFCEVTGYVAPSVNIALWLPEAKKWNGKLIELGCGGLCGTTQHVVLCADPLRRGYACIVSDQGHHGLGNLWIHNNFQAQIDIAYRATHVAALSGKAIVAHYYGRAPEKSYFMGGSGGGREGMMEAQRFPWDFNGIIAACPSLAPTGNLLSAIWANRLLTGGGKSTPLGQGELDVLHRAVVAKCDLNDGIEDGLIGDPRKCMFDPAALLCGRDRATACLTQQQIDVAKKFYAPPMDSKGDPINLPFAMKGSERTWLQRYASLGGFADQFRVWFQPDPGPNWQPEDFDFDRDHKRLGMGDGFSSATNPDLRKFKAAGGKLLSYVGWNDLFAPLTTVDYYETVEKTLGGRTQTRDFYRFFTLPGVEHCVGGDGAATVDWLSYLEAWVERGEAPDRIIAYHIRTDDLRIDDEEERRESARRNQFPLDSKFVEFSRPAYPYPTVTKYTGRGDPKNAASFGPKE